MKNNNVCNQRDYIWNQRDYKWNQRDYKWNQRSYIWNQSGYVWNPLKKRPCGKCLLYSCKNNLSEHYYCTKIDKKFKLFKFKEATQYTISTFLRGEGQTLTRSGGGGLLL